MLLPVRHHPWDLSPKEAIALQRELASQIDMTDANSALCRVLTAFHTIAGIDVGIKGEMVMTFPELQEVERVCAELPITMPYIPGLLSFREAPVILDALARMEHTPDVLIFDGQGYAHPRRMGIATHVGILLDHPTVGCAKSRLCGTHEEPGPERGSYTWLRHQEEIIGAVLRTRTRVRPVYVSVGHRIRLETVIDLILRCGAGYRLPEPTRWAHRVASGTRQRGATIKA